MKNNPPVTVLLPVYNAHKYLDEAIRSILDQTYTDFEFLIIDDGSTDRSPSIIRTYVKKDKRIKFIQHKTNKGFVDTLNEGLTKAKGKYIARMDHDDVSLPRRLKLQYKFMQSHPNIGVVGTWFQYIDEKGVKGKKVKYDTDNTLLKWDLLFYNPIAHPTAFIRKSSLRKIDKYRKDFYLVEDYDLWSRVIAKTQHQLANLPHVLLYYRIHPDSMCRSETKNQWGMVVKMMQRNMSLYHPVTYNEAELFLKPISPKLAFLKQLGQRQDLCKVLIDKFCELENISIRDKKRVIVKLRKYEFSLFSIIINNYFPYGNIKFWIRKKYYNLLLWKQSKFPKLKLK